MSSTAFAQTHATVDACPREDVYTTGEVLACILLYIAGIFPGFMYHFFVLKPR